MNITIVMRPVAVEMVCKIVSGAGCRLTQLVPNPGTTELSKYYQCRVPRNATTEDIAQWIMEALQEVDGVEAAYIKPEASLADWKIQEQL